MMSEMLKVYKEYGVLKLANLFDEKSVLRIHEAIDAYIEGVLPNLPEADYVMEADGKSVRNLWRMEKHAAFFDELANSERLLGVVAPFVNGAPVVMSVETFNKPAQSGSGVPPHQDNAYFCLEPPDALTLWIAIDRVTKANGPVSYVRGSHHSGMRDHVPSGVSGNSMALADTLERHGPYAPLLEPGDALIHHCEVVHYSAANRSDEPRCGLLIVYRGAHCVRNQELHDNYAGAQ
jgi:ectoine hydroxylase-related dioxygenase (phytanoyl-CoA dioxygenase family)